MADKSKCGQCNARDVFSKGLCSGCYGKNWRSQRRAERDAAIAEQFPPKQLTSGVTEAEMTVVEAEVIQNAPPDPHLIALNPAQMAEARGDMKVWLEQRLSVIERDIVEANAALNEAKRNGWATGALLSARNRAVDDETFYHKILMAVEAGHTIIPEFPISIFAVRAKDKERGEDNAWIGYPGKDTHLHRPAQSDTLPAGAGEYRNPLPEVQEWRLGSVTDSDGRERVRWSLRRTGRPLGPITFPMATARSPIMQATAMAMADKVFDQFGICLPVSSAPAARVVQRPVQAPSAPVRTGDPLIIGQIVRKQTRKVVSFIIAWHFNLNDL